MTAVLAANAQVGSIEAFGADIQITHPRPTLTPQSRSQQSQFLLPLALLATSAFSISINTPQNVSQCEQVPVSWDNFTAPVDVYYLSEPGSNASGTVVSNYSANDFDWTVSVLAGNVLRLVIFDDDEEFASSDPFTVGGSDNASCLNTAA